MLAAAVAAVYSKEANQSTTTRVALNLTALKT